MKTTNTSYLVSSPWKTSRKLFEELVPLLRAKNVVKKTDAYRAELLDGDILVSIPLGSQQLRSILG